MYGFFPPSNNMFRLTSRLSNPLLLASSRRAFVRPLQSRFSFSTVQEKSGDPTVVNPLISKLQDAVKREDKEDAFKYMDELSVHLGIPDHTAQMPRTFEEASSDEALQNVLEKIEETKQKIREARAALEKNGPLDPKDAEHLEAILDAKLLLDHPHQEEEEESIPFWQGAGKVAALIVGIFTFYWLFFPEEHVHREKNYPHMHIRTKSFPWGEKDLLDYSKEHDDEGHH